MTPYRECLVELEEVHLLHRHASMAQRLGQRNRGSRGEPLGVLFGGTLERRRGKMNGTVKW